MAREWSYQLVNGEGMVIRRDYSQDERGRVTLDNEEVEFRAFVDAGTYNVVDVYGQVVETVTLASGGEITVSGVDEFRLTKGELPTARIVGTYGGVPVYADPEPVTLLPSGVPAPDPRMRWRNCTCPLCIELNLKGANMDREQVARIAADIGSSLMPDNSQWINRFTVSSRSSSRVYTVAQRRSDDVWGCSCPSWINRRHCKHLTDILERLAKLTEFDVTDPAVLEMLRSARVAYLDLDTTVAFPVTKAPAYRRALDL